MFMENNIKNTKQQFGILITATVCTIIGIALGYGYSQFRLVRRDAREIVKPVAKFGNYSSVNWKRVDDAFYRPCSADWDDNITVCEAFPMDEACRIWHLMQNAKEMVHQQTLPLRMQTGPDVWDALNAFESQFDSVFVNCVGQEYYLRLFPDVYNEIMGPAVTRLFESLSPALSIK